MNTTVFMYQHSELYKNMDQQDISSICHRLCEQFRSSVHLLFLDDNTIILETIPGLFASPLFDISTASSSGEAQGLIAKKNVWHCWILDIAIENEDSGLQFLTQYPYFPFTVILSGIRSMSIASQAVKLGAFRVFDKNPITFDSFYAEICKIAALSYILNGKGSKYLNLFNLPVESSITTPEDWAEKGCMTVRQLERICTSHSSLTPRLFLPFFYTLEFLLSSFGFNQFTPPPPESQLYKHIVFTFKNIDKFVASA